MIYLDNAATTKMSDEVLKEMMPYLTEEFGNAGTIYGLGRFAANAVNVARKRVAEFVNAKTSQIVFTASGTEANNMVFKGVAKYLLANNKTRILVSSVEHDSVLKAAKSLEDDGFNIDLINVKGDGEIDLDHLQSLLAGGDVGLVSVMFENNEVGTINPVRKVAELCRANGALFHTDCVQVAGWQKLSVGRIACDFLSISGHKIHGPKGVGALYIRNPKIMDPLVYGGATQEFGLRGGTENVPGIVGLGKACDVCSANYKTAEDLKKLRCVFYNELKRGLDERELGGIVRVNGPKPNVPGKIINLHFSGIDGETLLLMLDAEGMCVSAGSACRAHISEPSHVLKAMGLSDNEARNSIRVSFSVDDTVEEVTEAAGILAKSVALLLELSDKPKPN